MLWLGSIAFFALGIVLVLLGVHQADMARDLGLGLSAFGLLGALLSLAFGIGLTAAGPLIDRLPRRPLFVAACALAGVALISVDDRISQARLAIHLCLLGLGGGCYITIFNAAVLDRYRERSAPALAIMHAATTAGAASGPWLIALGQSVLGHGWRHTFHALGALYLCLALLGTAFALPRRQAATRMHDTPPEPRRWWSPALLALMTVGFAYVGVETGLTLFAIPWAESQGHSAAAGRSAISAFWLGLMIGRLLLVVRRPTPTAAWLSACGTIGALVVCAALLWSWPLVVAMGGAGLALGGVYPVMIALTGRHFPAAGTALGLVAGAGACGGFVLPWISGAIGDAFEARYAIALLGVSPLLIVGGALVLAADVRTPPKAGTRTLLLCCLALIGFAGNSLLSRLALRPHWIDPATFTMVRLGTGAAALLLLSRLRAKRAFDVRHGSWTSAWLLLSYAVPFTWAYLRIGAGIGALILFGAVQVTMIGWGIGHGERPGAREWFGLVIALLGLGLLTLPGATRPDPVGLGLMVIAGVAWGAYSLRGRESGDPLAATTGNFVRSAPLAAVAWIAARVTAGPESLHVERGGLAFAAASGALASGLGYTLWYAALPGLSATRAALVQLSVPVLAAGAASVLLGEPLSLRLVSASVLVLGGVLIAVRRRAARAA